MTDERDEQEEMDSLNELGDEELEPILSEGKKPIPTKGTRKRPRTSVSRTRKIHGNTPPALPG